jgi:hypothetical protein
MGFFRGNNRGNNDNNDPPGGGGGVGMPISPSSIFGGNGVPAGGKGGSLYSFDRGNGKSSFKQLSSDFGKGASPAPAPTRTMRKG